MWFGIKIQKMLLGKISRIGLFILFANVAIAQTDTCKVDSVKVKKFKPIVFFGVEISRIPTYKVLNLKPYYDLSPFISVQKQNTIYYYRYGIATNAHSLGIGIRISNR